MVAATTVAPEDDLTVLVAVRVRPMTKSETEESNGEEVIKVLDRRFVITNIQSNPDDPLRGNRVREKKYAFDYVFDEHMTQEEIYNLTTRNLVDGVLEGFNATVFSYGATGAGKTYTMIGDTSKPGIMVLTLKDLFERIQHIRNSEYEYKAIKV
eukprot:974598-Prorocentrum_minimum.AAC.4